MVRGEGQDEDAVDGERTEKRGKQISVVWMSEGREESKTELSWQRLSLCHPVELTYTDRII